MKNIQIEKLYFSFGSNFIFGKDTPSSIKLKDGYVISSI